MEEPQLAGKASVVPPRLNRGVMPLCYDNVTSATTLPLLILSSLLRASRFKSATPAVGNILPEETCR